jgi:hypothetical protein
MAYSLSYSNAIVSEGATLTITLSNTGLPDGTLVPFSISGTGITKFDFLNLTSLTGNFIIRSGIGTITLLPAQDLNTEGTESFILRLTGPGRTENIGITILDTSTQSNATAQFYITTSSPTTDEGATVIFTVRGVNVPSGTVVPYQMFGIEAADVYNTPLTGNLIFTANSNYDTLANVTLQLVQDFITEGTENIAMLIYPTGAFSLEISGTTTIIDTSTSDTGYIIVTTNKTKVREGESITFTVEGININAGSNVSYQIVPYPYDLSTGETISPVLGDFSNLTSFFGEFNSLATVGSSNVTSITFNILDDYVYEPTEYFYLAVFSPQGLYSRVSSPVISILDSGNILIKTNEITSGNVTLSFLEKAILQANIGALTNKPGYWIDTTGQVSDAMVLQGKSLDATEQSLVLYQPFSYVIRSSLSIDKWKESVKTVLHPAGFALFSEINNETDPNYMNDVSINSTDDSEIFTYSTTTIDSTREFLNVSNVNYNYGIDTLPLVVDIVSFITNPQ